MFTGLIEEVGEVAGLRHKGGSAVLDIRCRTVLDDAVVGDSIAVNGCCLTVTALLDDGGFSCDMMGETLDRTALGDVVVGDPVNLERAMSAGARLGGHLVQGHVDGVATVTAIEPHEEWTTVTYDLPSNVARYVVEKGSISIDGTSLTVSAVGDAEGPGTREGWFQVGLIPHTLAVTTHGSRSVGDRVNLEVDVIAKYVERMLSAGVTSPYSPAPSPSDPSAPGASAAADPSHPSHPSHPGAAS